MNRVVTFVAVGAAGFAVQLAMLSLLLTAGVHLPLATAAAVETAVLHNFLWHERWTWWERTGSSGWLGRLLRFHSANATISLTANLVLTWMFVSRLGLTPIVANTLAVGFAAAANYLAADRWVFARRASLVVGLWLLMVSGAWAGPSRATLDAWRVQVESSEAHAGVEDQQCVSTREPKGGSTAVTGGTVARWHACTVAKQTTVDALVDALIASGTPPPQADVLEARLLDRDGDHLRVYLKVQRRAVITVTLDTEHEVFFERTSRGLARSRSISTGITQTDGGDHGFLWRLNSYWTYRQVGDDVRIDLLSLSLSRTVPLLLRPIAGPIITSVAKDSMIRTLDAVRRFAEALAPGG